MKMNELSLHEMQQITGGSAMPPMPGNDGAGDLTIKQAPTDTPPDDPRQTGMFGVFSPWDQSVPGMGGL